MASSFVELASGIDIVHLHGVSQKSLLVIALAKLLGKKIVIKLTSVGHDDPASIRATGALMWTAYRQADRFIGVTPRFAEGFGATGLDREPFRVHSERRRSRSIQTIVGGRSRGVSESAAHTHW